MVKKKSKVEELFDFTIAGSSKPNMQAIKPYYTNVLNGKKRLTYQIVLMKPADFIKNSYRVFDVKIEKVKVKDISNMPRKFALPWIDITRKKSLGQGRAFACLKSKIEEIPVLVVAKTDKELKDWIKKTKVKKWAN
ncbi:MAG TPA: hypothetical protein ENI23_00455 [bacterium]|nr:hypothetical protein [bacterium]